MTTATKPREFPVLMHARSIEGIQAGRKRQTRRIVKPQPEWNGARWVWPIPKRAQRPGCATECVSASREWHEYMPPGCSPYGEPGDLLYVRETWRPHSWPEGEPVTVEFRDDTRFEADHYSVVEDFDRYSDWEERVGRTACQQLEARGVIPDEAGIYTWEGESPLPWRPGIHLPKWCSRIWLRVTDVRVERVQEISTEDVWAEGVQIPASETGSPLLRFAKPGKSEPAAAFLPKGRLFGFPNHEPLTTDELARIYFAELWDETNGAGAWERNDQVWVIGFEPAEAPRG